MRVPTVGKAESRRSCKWLLGLADVPSIHLHESKEAVAAGSSEVLFSHCDTYYPIQSDPKSGDEFHFSILFTSCALRPSVSLLSSSSSSSSSSPSYQHIHSPNPPPTSSQSPSQKPNSASKSTKSQSDSANSSSTSHSHSSTPTTPTSPSTLPYRPFPL